MKGLKKSLMKSWPKTKQPSFECQHENVFNMTMQSLICFNNQNIICWPFVDEVSLQLPIKLHTKKFHIYIIISVCTNRIHTNK